MPMDDAFAKLPGDPELAFIELVEILDTRVAAASGHGYDEADAARRYVDTLRAFADEYDVEARFREMRPSHFENWNEFFREFSSDVTYTAERFRFRHLLGAALASSGVELNDARRHEIHKLTLKIRKVVAVLDVPEAKRDAIYKRVSALDREVDQSKTRFGTLMALVLETSGTLGEAAKRLEPVAKLVQKITSQVADQKAETELDALPKPADQKQIAPPPDLRQSRPAEIDDEIPF